MKKRRINLRLVVAYTIGMVIHFTIFSIVFGFVVNYMITHGYISSENRFMGFLAISIFMIISSTLSTSQFGKKTINEVAKISKATKEVAKGNFDIRLETKKSVYEIEEMTKNFNIMAEALSNNEMLKSDFINNVSHEFKTPLSTIQGYATLLQTPKISDDKMVEYTNKILSSTRKLTELTDSILLLSKIENQVIDIVREPYRFDEQIRQVLLGFEYQWSEKHLNLDIDLQHVILHANDDLMYHVLRNLIDNAIKYSKHGGDIIVKCRETDGNVEFLISDTGYGMAEDVVKNIFEKFYQGDKSRNVKGNGLGLTLAHRIVKLHDGSIDVRSKESKGSTFVVRILNTKETAV